MEGPFVKRCVIGGSFIKAEQPLFQAGPLREQITAFRTQIDGLRPRLYRGRIIFIGAIKPRKHDHPAGITR